MALVAFHPDGGADISRAEAGPPTASLRGPVTAGCLIVLAFFGGFGTWAALAPLNAAVVADAVVKVAGNRKSVQHLEGGIVKEIRVKEGDTVRRGDVLFVLNADQAQADYDVLTRQQVFLTAAEARLKAETEGRDTVVFPAALTELGTPDALEAMDNQREEFASRRAALEGQVTILEEHIGQLEQEASGAKAQAATYRTQLASVRAEEKSLAPLLAKGYVPRTRLLQLQRTADGLKGQAEAAEASVAQAAAAIEENRRRIDQLRKDRNTEANRDRRDIEWKLLDVAPRVANARDRLERSQIRSPYSGKVVALNVFSVGAVIAPGERLLDIVPDEAALEVEAKIAVQDISDVHPGMRSEVHFTAYKQKGLPIIHGTVAEVSADRLTDERTQTAYYVARVEVDQKELAASPQVRLYPGMPATVMITTKERSALDYLISPLTQSFDHALNER